jgi:hypothetical protein
VSTDLLLVLFTAANFGLTVVLIIDVRRKRRALRAVLSIINRRLIKAKQFVSPYEIALIEGAVKAAES